MPPKRSASSVSPRGNKKLNQETLSSSLRFSQRVLDGLSKSSDEKSKIWFENYVKGTKWFGCKTPIIRKVIKTELLKQSNTSSSSSSSSTTRALSSHDLISESIHLLCQEECDAKLAGMLLLQEEVPTEHLCSRDSLQRLIHEVILKNHINDWSTADWFAIRVLQKIALNGDHELALKILSFTLERESSLWHRRCGVVSFVYYYKNRDKLPTNFGCLLVEHIEKNLLISPEERFTQTGCAWILRYCLIGEKAESDLAMEVIMRNKKYWSKEALKSLVEKLGKNDPRRTKILN